MPQHADPRTVDPYPIDPTRALPTVAYRDRDQHRLEMERVWRGGWVWVGTADQVAHPGDHFPTVVGDQPVIVGRRTDGSLAAMSNLCGHRGTLLVDEPGNTKRFQCPYHAWTFADDGRLLAVPHADRSEIDRDAHALPTYAAGEWFGLVFVNLAPDPVPLGEYLSHLSDVVEPLGIERLHHWTGERGDEKWAANWKLVIATAMESYHLFQVHPETLEPYTPTADAFYIVGAAAGTATGGKGKKGVGDYVLLSLPPNFVGVVTGGNLLWQAVQPIDVGRSRIVTGGAYPSPSPSKSRGITKLLSAGANAVSNAVVPDFLPEDKAICERGQTAAIGDFAPGRLVEAERVVSDFHHLLNHRLHGVAPPEPHRAEPVAATDSDAQHDQ